MERKKRTGLAVLGTLALLSAGWSTGILTEQDPAWMAPASAKTLKNPKTPEVMDLIAAKAIYTKSCASCHGKKGKGDGPSAATLGKQMIPLADAKVQGQTDGELFWKITEGRKPMPSARKSLSDTQRWSLVNYMRSLASTTAK